MLTSDLCTDIYTPDELREFKHIHTHTYTHRDILTI